MRLHKIVPGNLEIDFELCKLYCDVPECIDEIKSIKYGTICYDNLDRFDNTGQIEILSRFIRVNMLPRHFTPDRQDFVHDLIQKHIDMTNYSPNSLYFLSIFHLKLGEFVKYIDIMSQVIDQNPNDKLYISEYKRVLQGLFAHQNSLLILGSFPEKLLGWKFNDYWNNLITTKRITE